MNLHLSAIDKIHGGSIRISGSKSESNRLLVLQALFPQIHIENGSDSDDSVLLQNALVSEEKEINIQHSGTAMRFLTAYFSIQKGRETLLTGSKRMQERPIGILVEALRGLGADISCQKKEGFPPLLIKGKNLTGSKASLTADVSSQYISALMLIAPKMQNGLEINLETTPISRPYIKMTASLLEEIGIKSTFNENKIKVFPTSTVEKKSISVESDWSSASYFYSIVALSENSEIELCHFKENSLQGDSEVAKMYEQFGAKTGFSNTKIFLRKTEEKLPTFVKEELSGTPDLAQTLIVTCCGLKIPCEISGLKSLKIKETDRLAAMKNELEKFGAKVTISDNSIEMQPPEKFPHDIEIETYNDHRMAMAFAPLALKTPLTISDSGVVSKSYPRFWEAISKIGFDIKRF